MDLPFAAYTTREALVAMSVEKIHFIKYEGLNKLRFDYWGCNPDYWLKRKSDTPFRHGKYIPVNLKPFRNFRNLSSNP